MRKIKLLMFGVVLAALLAVPGAAMAKSKDRDHDKLPDKWEQKFHLSTHHKSAKGDPDRDGLNNLGEFRSHTNPRKADTNGNGVNDANDDQDNDGVDNADEMGEHTNPADPDTDNDGIEDGNETSGTVDTFVEDSAHPGTGMLTILLSDGSKVTGTVDSTTRIECRAPRANDNGTMHQRDGADDGPNHDAGDDNGGDNSGPGNSGDDNNGGDDHSGPGRGGDDERQCTTADLAHGTPVHEAELQGTGADAVFEKIELLK